MTNLDHPFRIDRRGRAAAVDENGFIHDLIEQVLFTSPGERVNRPAFGSGLMQLVFAPNSDTLAAATQVSVQGALQQWVGDWIEVESVDVHHQDSTLRVEVRYLVRRTQQRQSAQFTRSL